MSLRRAAFGEGPGGEHDEGRLHELRRLDAERPEHDPAMRALDLGAELEAPADHERHADRHRPAAPGAGRGAATGRRPTIMISDGRTRNSTWRLTKWKVDRPSRSATGGPPAMQEARGPSTISAASAASSSRSTVHHQSPKRRAFRARHHGSSSPCASLDAGQAPGRGRGSDRRAPRNSELVVGGAGRREQHDRLRGCRARRVRGRRCDGPVEGAAAHIRERAPSSVAREFVARLADQIGLARSSGNSGRSGVDAALLRLAAEDPEDVVEGASAFSVASALVALESLMKSTRPRRPTSSMRCGKTGKGPQGPSRSRSASTPSAARRRDGGRRVLRVVRAAQRADAARGRRSGCSCAPAARPAQCRRAKTPSPTDALDRDRASDRSARRAARRRWRGISRRRRRPRRRPRPATSRSLIAA